MTQQSPSYEEIKDRAYEIYLLRGVTDGHDLEDWLQAERDLRGACGSKASTEWMPRSPDLRRDRARINTAGHGIGDVHEDSVKRSSGSEWRSA